MCNIHHNYNIDIYFLLNHKFNYTQSLSRLLLREFYENIQIMQKNYIKNKC